MSYSITSWGSKFYGGITWGFVHFYPWNEKVLTSRGSKTWEKFRGLELISCYCYSWKSSLKAL